MNDIIVISLGIFWLADGELFLQAVKLQRIRYGGLKIPFLLIPVFSTLRV